MNPKLIYDVGMHIGGDSDFYLKKGFNVVGVEANPALVAFCERRFAFELSSGQLKIVNRAIAERARPIDFYINEDNDLWGSADRRWAERDEKKSRVIAVEASTMQMIFAEFGMPYYMKVDIEGHDILCLRGLQACPIDRSTFPSNPAQRLCKPQLSNSNY